MNRLTTMSELYALLLDYPEAAKAREESPKNTMPMQTWLAQRQQDMRELASPAGRTLALAVRQVWETIDEQLRDLRLR
jgi:hypothetical protein